MKKIINSYVKNQMSLGMTGVGLGMMSSFDTTGVTGKLASGVGTLGSINTLGTMTKICKKVGK